MCKYKNLKAEIATDPDARFCRVVKLKDTDSVSEALNEALSLADKEEEEYVYQITANLENYEIEQPIWDFFNGDISNFYFYKGE